MEMILDCAMCRDGAPLCVTSPRHGLEPQTGDPGLVSSKELSIGISDIS